MNVTFYAPYAFWSPHFETDLELMELHLEQGDEVTFISCDAALSFCEVNEKHDFSVCAQCIGRALEGLRRLSRPVRVLKLSELIIQAKHTMKGLEKLPRRYRSFSELYQLKVDHFDIGAAVLSTLNSMLEDPEPDPSMHEELTWATLSAGFAAYAALDRYLSRTPCDLFYFLNGRLANFRAALRACQKHRVRCLVHERGCDHHSYSLAENTMPHLPEHISKYIAATLAKAKSPEEKRAIAKQFYIERQEGKIANWISFTEQQVRGSLPEAWLEAAPRIAAFSSTESEFACLREYYRPQIYPSQAEGFELIIHDLARRNFQGVVAVRMHPNSARTKSDFTQRLRTLPYPFLRLIAPEDKIDSYTLLRTADKVLTFGSTIGIEAAYRGIPSILARWAAYEDLGSTYNPNSHEELMQLLLDPIDPKPADGAVDYAYYAKTFGNRLKYVTPLSAFSCAFKGRLIHPQWPYLLFNRTFSGDPVRVDWPHPGKLVRQNGVVTGITIGDDKMALGVLEGMFAAGVIEPETQELECLRNLYPALINWEKKRLKALYKGRGIRPDPLNLLVAWERKRSISKQPGSGFGNDRC
jgi:Capsule polysaccharide biosynthesis protein